MECSSSLFLWNDANGDGKAGYVPEHGACQLKIMDNSHELSTVAAEFNLSRDIFFENDPVTGMPIMNLFDDAAGGDETEQIVYLSRSDFAGTFPKPVTSNTGRASSEAVKAASKITVEDDPNAVPVVTGAKNGLTLDDVVGLDYDDPKWDGLLDQLSLEDMESIVTNGAFGTAEVASIGMKATVHADGPQGVSAWMFGVSGTSYPVQMYVAQTWNPEIAKEQGVRAGQDLWLTLFVTPGELQIDETNPTAQQAMIGAQNKRLGVADYDVQPMEEAGIRVVGLVFMGVVLQRRDVTATAIMRISLSSAKAAWANFLTDACLILGVTRIFRKRELPCSSKDNATKTFIFSVPRRHRDLMAAALGALRNLESLGINPVTLSVRKKDVTSDSMANLIDVYHDSIRKGVSSAIVTAVAQGAQLQPMPEAVQLHPAYVKVMQDSRFSNDGV